MTQILDQTYLTECFKQARYYIYCKEEERVLEILKPIWKGVGEAPQIEGLPPEMACELLMHCGSVLSLYALQCQNGEYHEKAEDYLTRAHELALNLDDREQLAEIEKNMAVAYWREGRYDNAIVYSNTVFSHYTRAEQVTSEICLLTKANLIILYLRTGEHDESLKIIQEIEVFVKQSENLWLQTTFYNHTSTFFMAVGKYQKAEGFLLEAIRCARESKNYNYLGSCLNNLGYLHLQLDDTENALVSIEQAIVFYTTRNTPFYYALALETKASVQIRRNEMEKAMHTINESIAILRRGENFVHLCESMWTRCTILIKTNERRRAILEFNELLNISQTHLSQAVTDSYIDKLNSQLYIQGGSDFYEKVENFRLYLLDEALEKSGGIVKPTARHLGISHQNTSALLKKTPELCKKHGVNLRTRRANRSVFQKSEENTFAVRLKSDRLHHLGLGKDAIVSVNRLPLSEMDLSKLIVIKDRKGKYHCGYLVSDFGMYAFGDGTGSIESTYFEGDFKETGQVVGFYDKKTDDFRPIEQLDSL